MSSTAVVFVAPSQTFTPASETQRHFQRQINPRRGPVRLGEPWVDKSLMSCANNCMKTFQNCTSFLFSSLTGQCTPSSYINEKQILPSSAEGDFFQSFYCDTSKGFNVTTYGDTVACVGLFGSATYVDADADCQSKGAYLMAVKTEEKYFLLSNNVTDITNAWIGCDDMLQEGTFVWKEDGQEVTSVERTAVFDQSDPITDDNEQDCMGFDPAHARLRGNDCSVSQNYVCEMPYG